MKETNAAKKDGSFFEKHAEIWKFVKFTFAGAFSSLIELGVFALLQYVVFKSLNDVPVTDSPAFSRSSASSIRAICIRISSRPSSVTR